MPSAEPKQTCPDINKLQRTIKGIVSDMKYYANLLEDSDKKSCLSTADDIENLIGELEDLRSANDSIRKWGREWEKEAEKFEESLLKAEERIQELEYLIN